MLPLFLYLLTPVLAAALPNTNTSQPTAKVLNGTYIGRALPEWNQDVFLGIPYAQPPVGDLRFRWPQSLASSWNGTREVTEYGHTCYQHPGTYSITEDMDEDCLVLNIVRPTGYDNTTLPVLVWIYGGGLYAGSAADPRYNLSALVHTASTTHHPFIAISLNYRLGIWGFLQSTQILAEGSANAGLLDQRMALRWVQENIAAFGGDPSRVTVWGESAGAQSIGLHLVSYGGRDDGLFAQAILESGGPVGVALNPITYYASPFENLTRTLGCWDASSSSNNPLPCLRSLSAETLNTFYGTQTWNPIVDGDFLPSYPSTLLALGHFLPTPLLTGTNTDEGTSFSIKGLDNATALALALAGWRDMALAPDTIATLLSLYPDDATTPKPPFHVAPSVVWPKYGTQWRRSAAVGGDLVMHSQRRKMAEAYSAAAVPVFSYRFDTPAWNGTVQAGVAHFVNVPFSFRNVSGGLGPLPGWEGEGWLSEGIGRAYARFVGCGDPNGEEGGEDVLPQWPRYSVEEPRNMVLNANGSWVEPDTWRREGIAFINSVDRELLA